jgi:hypothetical protein
MISGVYLIGFRAGALKKLEEGLFSPSQPLKRLGLQFDQRPQQ